MTSIIVDSQKVNLLEKDIEDWLWDNPSAIRIEGTEISRWIARQFKLPSGIIDLLGVINNEGVQPVVVEVKNTEITSEALTQVMRYANDIDSILVSPEFTLYKAEKVIIGKGFVSGETMFAAEAMGIRLYSFNVNLNLSIDGPWCWKDEYTEKLWEQYDQISKDPIFENFKTHPKENILETDKNKTILDEAKRIMNGEIDMP